MNIIKTLLALSVVFAVSGCDDTKSVDWWKEHQEEATQKVDECKAKGDDSVNCRNAKEAVFKVKQKNASVPTFN